MDRDAFIEKTKAKIDEVECRDCQAGSEITRRARTGYEGQNTEDPVGRNERAAQQELEKKTARGRADGTPKRTRRGPTHAERFRLCHGTIISRAFTKNAANRYNEVHERWSGASRTRNPATFRPQTDAATGPCYSPTGYARPSNRFQRRGQGAIRRFVLIACVPRASGKLFQPGQRRGQSGKHRAAG